LAIHNCRFSLRKIEYDTKYNLVYRWLTGDKIIDHSTIGKFLNKFKQELIDLFSQVVTIAKDEKLLDFDLLAIDTVKIRANASYKQTKSLDAIQETKITLAGQLKELIENETQTENNEKAVLENRIQRLKERMRENDQEKTINITDHDCKIVQQANGEKNPGYCITTAVEKTGSFEKNGRNYNLYSNRKACMNCPHRTKCTDGDWKKLKWKRFYF